MPTTYDDLGEGGQCTITVRVRDCSRARAEKRSFELTVEDIEGTRFPFIVWEKSEQGRNYQWEEGQWYRLKGVTANSWPSGTVLHGATALEIEDLGSGQDTNDGEILYITDSHLGKRTHSYKGRTWSVSPEEGFCAAIECAIEEDVDAVVHGGDLFHNPGTGIGDREVALCRESLIRLAEAGIPFYFIYGNHERDAGRRVMGRLVDDSLAVHLGPRYETVGGAIALYGIDYQSVWSDSVLDLQPAQADLTTVLCLHQAVEPFTESSSPDCTLRDIHTGTHVPLDIVAVGHTHSRARETIEGGQGISGGSTARVGAAPADISPSVELISTAGSPTVNRRLL